MVTKSQQDVRPLENDQSPGSEDTERKADRSPADSEAWIPNHHVRLFLSLVAKLERNWALSAALILGAIIVASVL